MLDTGCWILDAGCWMLDTGYWMLDTGCWILDAGCWMKVIKIPSTKKQIPNKYQHAAAKSHFIA
jgi:hypothetical protein